MSHRFALRCSAALLFLAAACANGNMRGGLTHDMGGPLDSGHADGGDDGSTTDSATDSGLGTDTGMDTDAGPDAPPGSDAGPDLGRPDLGAPDAGCTSAASCSDGLACNGVERCVSGFCSGGTPVVCDDGIACTRDSCAEPGGTCSFVRDDSLCPVGQACTASTASGCAPTSSCSESPCRLVTPQCGCGPGLACTIAGTSRVCSTPGTGTAGSACTGPCSTGNLCVTLSSVAGTPSACESFCASDADCSGAGALCILTLNDGAGGSIPGVTLCSLSCTPTGAAAAGCPSGSACRIYTEMGGAMRGLTHCGALGTGAVGSACTTDDTCRAGMLCADIGTGSTTCEKVCNNVGLACSGGGGTCTGFATPLLVGTTEYGVCA